MSSLLVDLTAGSNATIHWTTNEPTRGLLDYGVSPASGTSLDLGGQLRRTNGVTLGGVVLVQRQSP